VIEEEDFNQRLARALVEVGARPKVFGPHFDRLVPVIEEELNVAFAMNWFGEDQPTPDVQTLHQAAVMIADGVDHAFRLEPHPKLSKSTPTSGRHHGPLKAFLGRFKPR
jgi:hypothetical protein